MERNCDHCGQSFPVTKKHPNKRFCSLRCCGNAHAPEKRLPPMQCAQCGDMFISRSSRRKYCSQRCSGIASNSNRVWKSPEDRFWEFVSKTDDCWVWTGLLSTKGYGMFSIKGVYLIASRFSWSLHHGPILDDLHVLHKCDTPACVRPDHLFLGTHQDNMEDKVKKSRHYFGERHKAHKLTEFAVREIRDSKMSHSDLAKFWCVNQSVISRIRARKSWKHVL